MIEKLPGMKSVKQGLKKLASLPHGKKEKIEENEQLSSQDAETTSQESAAGNGAENQKQKASQLNSITAEIEKLKAKTEALSEMRKADSERFSYLSEQLGQMRGLILEKEKQIKDISVQSATAADLVQQLKPQTILGEIKKGMSKVDIIDAKVGANEAIYKRISGELKLVRQKIEAFKGIDELMKLNQETKENLQTMKATSTKIEKQASKVENTFIQSQKQIIDLKLVKQNLDGMQQALSNLDTEFTKLRTKTETVAWVGDIQKLREDMDSLKIRMGEMAKKVEDTAELSAKSREMEKKVAAVMDEVSVLNTLRAYMKQKLKSFETELKLIEETSEHTAKVQRPKIE